MAQSNLPTRALGKDGPAVAAMGFGLMGLSILYGTKRPDAERFAVLDRAHALGATFWDSSDVYGDSESFVGQWFARTGLRNSIFIATKFGIAINPDGTRALRNEPSYIRSACDKSLKRLGVDTIDLYYCHRLSGKVPIEDVVSTLAELVREGKIKHIGLSEVSATTLRRAYKVHPIAAVQMEYSPFSLEIEHADRDLLRTCRELGTAVVAYSPLGRGFLAGRLRSLKDLDKGDWRRSMPKFAEENFDKNLELVDEIQKLADKKGCTAGQLVLAWLLRQGEDIVPIPGTSRIERLEENVKALEVQLTDEEVKEIRKAADQADIVGTRYPQDMAASLFADTPAKL